MKTRIFEATNGAAYGKFLVGRFDEEWKYTPQIEPDYSHQRLLHREGWGPKHFMLLDLSSPGNGSIFHHNPLGMAENDVEKRGLPFCLLYTEFLQWIYQQKLEEFDEWPAVVEFELFPHKGGG